MTNNSLNVLVKKLRNKAYAERTIEVYVSYIVEFILCQKIKDPYQVTTSQIEGYLLDYNYSSRSQQNQIISALKCFAKYFLNRAQIHLDKIERPRKETKIQPIIPRELIIEKLPQIENIKHRSIITLAYGCALRVSEVIALQWKHIIRDERIIEIKSSKGAKDRIVPISDSMIKLLELYWQDYKTKTYIFSGAGWRPQYSPASCNAIVKQIFGNRYRFHSLRKSSATHLYELGNDIGKIQDLLGHSKTDTTRIYVKTTIKSIKQLTELV
jgi:integrase/recombinase XerD